MRYRHYISPYELPVLSNGEGGTHIRPKANMARTPSFFLKLNLRVDTAIIGMVKINKSRARLHDATGTVILNAL